MRELTTPFPLDGGRVGVGGARVDAAVDGAEGVVDNASCANSLEGCANTPTQPSPIEGEGFSRFAREGRTAGRVVRRARRLRREPTHTEALLWEELRRLPVRFRRQAAMGAIIPDFVCHPAALVVEIDGGVHSLPDVAVRDLGRDAWSESQGYAVLRFPVRQVEDDIERVMSTIRNAASNRLKRVI
jgi:very-short-patch-repair endonuclease